MIDAAAAGSARVADFRPGFGICDRHPEEGRHRVLARLRLFDGAGRGVRCRLPGSCRRRARGRPSGGRTPAVARLRGGRPRWARPRLLSPLPALRSAWRAPRRCSRPGWWRLRSPPAGPAWWRRRRRARRAVPRVRATRPSPTPLLRRGASRSCGGLRRSGGARSRGRTLRAFWGRPREACRSRCWRAHFRARLRPACPPEVAWSAR